MSDVKPLRYFFFRFPRWTLCSTLCTRCATSFSWPLRTWEAPPRPPTATWPPWTGQYSTTGSNWGQTTSQRDSARTCDSCNAVTHAASASDVIFCAVKPAPPCDSFIIIKLVSVSYGRVVKSYVSDDFFVFQSFQHLLNKASCVFLEMALFCDCLDSDVFI